MRYSEVEDEEDPNSGRTDAEEQNLMLDVGAKGGRESIQLGLAANGSENSL
jgi:hypothetical protein